MRIVPLVAVVLLLHHAASAQIPNGGGGDVVRVTPKGEEGGTVATQRNGSSSVTFTVFNDGTGTGSYSFTCSSTGGISCGTVNPIGANILAGGSRDVTVGYSVGGGGGEVHLTASGNTSDQGWYVVTTSPTIAIVAPVLTSGSRALVHARQPIIRATFLAEGSPVGTNAVLKWRGEFVTSLARFNRGLIEWDVDSTRWLGIGDSALVEVTACAVNGLCNTVTRWAVLLNDNKPVLGFTGMPFEALGRQFGAPFGPGVSVSGAEVESGLSTPAYVSMGAARGAGLVYSTRQSYPRALVPVDLELTWPAGNPDQIKLILWDGATKLDSLVLSSPACATGGTRRCRAVLQGDFSASTFATPTRKWLTVEARVTSGATTQISTDSAEVVLVDRRSTPYGSGWWPAAALKLVGAGDDRLLVGPSGTAAVFRGNGDSLYVAPPGDFSSLVRIGSTWELQPRGSTAKLVFDSNGRLFKALDRNGNRDSIAYSGSSDQVTALFDPVGKSIAFGYDGNGKLSTITDPASRQNKVLINASTNQLTYDSVSSPTTRPYTTTFAYQAYSGTNTVVLTKRIGVVTDTTVVTYDSTFKRRPVQVRLPQVQDETGASVNPVIRYTAYERQGFGTLRSLDSVYVEMKDPRNNWTRSLLNRWGQARKTWDSLGVIGRSEFTAEGFVRWSEGKVADSSRVYNTYDALNRLARTYIVRAVGDTLRLDSLVYDASHRVIKHIDARGKRDSTAYDGNGNVLVTVSAHNDTTRFWYRADGRLDSTRAQYDTVARRFTYDTIWKNVVRVVQQDSIPAFERQLDALGRDSVTDRKRRPDVQPHPVCPNADCWQWHRTEVFYNVAGQVDSTQERESDLCVAPCTTPPAWNAPIRRVSARFDRAGRDSFAHQRAGTRDDVRLRPPGPGGQPPPLDRFHGRQGQHRVRHRRQRAEDHHAAWRYDRRELRLAEPGHVDGHPRGRQSPASLHRARRPGDARVV
jgi:YD repeat-containing protein